MFHSLDIARYETMHKEQNEREREEKKKKEKNNADKSGG